MGAGPPLPPVVSMPLYYSTMHYCRLYSQKITPSELTIKNIQYHVDYLDRNFDLQGSKVTMQITHGVDGIKQFIKWPLKCILYLKKPL